MTDNIFEIETTALAHVYWILSVLEKTELPEFINRFLRSMYNDSITHVEIAGATR